MKIFNILRIELLTQAKRFDLRKGFETNSTVFSDTTQGRFEAFRQEQQRIGSFSGLTISPEKAKEFSGNFFQQIIAFNGEKVKYGFREQNDLSRSYHLGG